MGNTIPLCKTMTDNEKITYVKVMLGINETTEDNAIASYLAITKETIINWQYHLIGRPNSTTLAPEYETIQVNACVAGYGQVGASGQSVHIENGIHRHWKYEDMLAYVESHVPCFARLL